MRRILFLFLMMAFVLPPLLRASEKDSLFTLLRSGGLRDSAKCKLLYEIAYYYSKKDPDSCRYYGKKTLEYAVSIGNRKYAAMSYGVIGLSLFNQGEYIRALEQNEMARKIAEQDKDTVLLGNIYNNLGNNFRKIGNAEKAAKFYFMTIEIKEKLNDKKGLASVYNNLGNLYNDQRRQDKSLEYHLRSLKLKEELGDEKGLAASYNNIGGIFQEQELFDKALEYHHKSLLIKEKLKDKKGQGSSLGNIGITYAKMGELSKALEFTQRSIKIKEEINDQDGLASSLITLGEIYFKRKDLVNARQSFLQARELAQRVHSLRMRLLAADWLAQTTEKSGMMKDAAFFYKEYAVLKDSLISEETSRQMNELNMFYETEKKQATIKELEQSQRINALEIKNNRGKIALQRFGLIGAGIILALICWMAYQFYKSRNKEKQAGRIIQMQKEILEEKNRDIIDSINYARRIQSAVLPSEQVLQEHFSESFVIYRPRDIVGGDFYWVARSGDYSFIAVADCTGHGVPGGFMSMLGISFLDEIVLEKKVEDPADILDLLRLKVIVALKQGGGEASRDGMDIALLRRSESSGEILFAGAMSRVVVITEGESREYRGDKQPVGVFLEEQKQFSQKKIESRAGSMIYLFTDGIADQFGGPKGKKFKHRNFVKLLQAHATEPIDNQENSILSSINSWRGSFEQVDDVTLIGIRL
ncbi:MAG: tetratricopeptide repeat protein [Bacteroidia bacterium]|nr:tetratricopeptide repeat protein [Bacteroidia bacterium]